MPGSRVPRNFLYAMTLGVIAAGVMLVLFYGQYLWMAGQIVTASYDEHRTLVEATFAQNAKSDLHAVAYALPDDLDASGTTIISQSLNRSMADNSRLVGLRLTLASGSSWSVGNPPQAGDQPEPLWLDNQLLHSYPIIRNRVEIGRVWGSFDLAPLQAELDGFATEMRTTSNQSRRISYLWIIGGTVTVLLLCGVVGLAILRGQTRRIRELKLQAERFRDADFGERVAVTTDDELGALAEVFNEMRDKLRTTTHSRDYVNSILSGMNEAIIVTSKDGHIKRINTATMHLLGYEEDELAGTSIDFITDRSKSGSLADDSPSGLPRDAVNQSKNGESIPVTYTSTIVVCDHSGDGDRINAAQNITERRRAEKRIRYLARIDPRTKIPNRMQFQHLLQRGIARARRAGKSLCLFYVDVDHFKEINDTFGHLAGDTTLETVAERLSATLPQNSVIGRLAGDEFAVIIDGLGADDESETAELAPVSYTHLRAHET